MSKKQEKRFWILFNRFDGKPGALRSSVKEWTNAEAESANKEMERARSAFRYRLATPAECRDRGVPPPEDGYTHQSGPDGPIATGAGLISTRPTRRKGKREGATPPAEAPPAVRKSPQRRAPKKDTVPCVPDVKTAQGRTSRKRGARQTPAQTAPQKPKMSAHEWRKAADEVETRGWRGARYPFDKAKITPARTRDWSARLPDAREQLMKARLMRAIAFRLDRGALDTSLLPLGVMSFNHLFDDVFSASKYRRSGVPQFKGFDTPELYAEARAAFALFDCDVPGLTPAMCAKCHHYVVEQGGKIIAHTTDGRVAVPSGEMCPGADSPGMQVCAPKLSVEEMVSRGEAHP